MTRARRSGGKGEGEDAFSPPLTEHPEPWISNRIKRGSDMRLGDSLGDYSPSPPP